jgi:hypothetical protein
MTASGWRTVPPTATLVRTFVFEAVQHPVLLLDDRSACRGQRADACPQARVAGGAQQQGREPRLPGGTPAHVAAEIARHRRFAHGSVMVFPSGQPD